VKLHVYTELPTYVKVERSGYLGEQYTKAWHVSPGEMDARNGLALLHRHPQGADAENQNYYAPMAYDVGCGGPGFSDNGRAGGVRWRLVRINLFLDLQPPALFGLRHIFNGSVRACTRTIERRRVT